MAPGVDAGAVSSFQTKSSHTNPASSPAHAASTAPNVRPMSPTIQTETASERSTSRVPSAKRSVIGIRDDTCQTRVSARGQSPPRDEPANHAEPRNHEGIEAAEQARHAQLKAVEPMVHPGRMALGEEAPSAMRAATGVRGGGWPRGIHPAADPPVWAIGSRKFRYRRRASARSVYVHPARPHSLGLG